MRPDTKTLVNDLTNYVNTMSMNPDSFCEEMSKQHRTLQQSFTRLCLAWLEHVANDDYPRDLRNERAHEVAKDMVLSYIDKHHWPPSNGLPLI